jgi:single-strand DNA-binding protein
MSNDQNVWTGEGRIGTDPKIDYVGESGIPKVFFVLANNRGFGDKKKTNWIPIIVWGERGEKIMQYLEKGRHISVSGELQISSWKDDDGNYQKQVQVNAREINFHANGNGNGNGNGDTASESDDPEPVVSEPEPTTSDDKADLEVW